MQDWRNTFIVVLVAVSYTIFSTKLSKVFRLAKSFGGFYRKISEISEIRKYRDSRDIREIKDIREYSEISESREINP